MTFSKSSELTGGLFRACVRRNQPDATKTDGLAGARACAPTRVLGSVLGLKKILSSGSVPPVGVCTGAEENSELRVRAPGNRIIGSDLGRRALVRTSWTRRWTSNDQWRGFTDPLTHQRPRRMVPPVTKTSSRLVIALAITSAVLMLIGFLFVLQRFSDEYWCSDRIPWWGPPTDPTSECSGFAWTEDHPGEFPWTLPR